MAEPYLDVHRFRISTVLPLGRLDELEIKKPGFLAANLERKSRKIEDRLRHKYAIPFPERHSTIEDWIIGLVQLDALVAIGLDPSDVLYVNVSETAALCETQITEASDLKSSNWNLPLKDAGNASAITKGGPKGYSESSPYTWTDVQGGAYRGR